MGTFNTITEFQKAYNELYVDNESDDEEGGQSSEEIVRSILRSNHQAKTTMQ
jgi:hypothetical protein